MVDIEALLAQANLTGEQLAGEAKRLAEGKVLFTEAQRIVEDVNILMLHLKIRGFEVDVHVEEIRDDSNMHLGFRYIPMIFIKAKRVLGEEWREVMAKRWSDRKRGT